LLSWADPVRDIAIAVVNARLRFNLPLDTWQRQQRALMRKVYAKRAALRMPAAFNVHGTMGAAGRGLAVSRRRQPLLSFSDSLRRGSLPVEKIGQVDLTRVSKQQGHP
jgi:hypothetical protein